MQYTGCTSAPDTLECLRAAPYATLKDAVDTTPVLFSPNGMDITWSISVDGDLIKKSLRQYVREGHYARVPIVGNLVDDEGTYVSSALSSAYVKMIAQRNFNVSSLFSLVSQSITWVPSQT